MDKVIMQADVIDAVRTGEIDPDSQIILDIDGFDAFKVTAVKGASEIGAVALFADDDD